MKKTQEDKKNNQQLINLTNLTSINPPSFLNKQIKQDLHSDYEFYWHISQIS
jgi:hypothetical protein